jgi:hypothetical protein
MPQPQVLRQISVGGGQIRAVVAEAGVAVVAPLRLDQQHSVAEAQAPDREAKAIRAALEAGIVRGRPPELLQSLPPLGWESGVPSLVGRQGEMIERGTVTALGVVAAARQQTSDQLIAIVWQGLAWAEAVSRLRHPAQHQNGTGRGVEADAVGETAVAGGVIGQHQRDAPLLGGGAPQRDPGGAELSDPGQALLVGHQSRQGGGQAAGVAGALLERSHAGGQAAVEFGQGHLKAEVERA